VTPEDLAAQFDLVTCPDCGGCGHRDVERGRDVIRRLCRACRGSDGRSTGRVLRGLPRGAAYDVVLTYGEIAESGAVRA